MIGVVAGAGDLAIIEEFFELFKTPWECAVPERTYRVVVSLTGSIDRLNAELFLLYASGEQPFDRTRLAGSDLDGPIEVQSRAATLPIYGRLATFGPAVPSSTLTVRGQALDCCSRAGSSVVRRIGYDLVHEVRHLLTEGQPASHARIPALELHIDLLRQHMRDAGIRFVEIPPSTNDADFICCLTHDVDFLGIRRHRFDRTLAGFVARASIGTLWDLCRGRRTPAEAGRNLLAVLSLPLVFLGLSTDFWQPFVDYARVEEAERSTFFLVPVGGRAGVSPEGVVEPARAVPYQVSEIHEEAAAATARGSELGVHGIDAWRDADAGHEELQQVTRLTGRATAGVRMHWLYFQADSPQRLEAAGFAYDSTWGYNDSVGYRAGTAQVFRLPGTERLMELPLSIMDSALFLSSRMALTRSRALEVCREIVANARQFGGTVVVNWHERSLAPERLWEQAYRELLDELSKSDRVWFATGSDAVEWFRWRRSIAFSPAATSSTGLRVSAPRPSDRPGVIRVHQPGLLGPETYDIPFDGRATVDVDIHGLCPSSVAADEGATTRSLSIA
jgi:hypothetical protein